VEPASSSGRSKRPLNAIHDRRKRTEQNRGIPHVPQKQWPAKEPGAGSVKHKKLPAKGRHIDPATGKKRGTLFSAAPFRAPPTAMPKVQDASAAVTQAGKKNAAEASRTDDLRESSENLPDATRKSGGNYQKHPSKKGKRKTGVALLTKSGDERRVEQGEARRVPRKRTGLVDAQVRLNSHNDAGDGARRCHDGEDEPLLLLRKAVLDIHDIKAWFKGISDGKCSRYIWYTFRNTVHSGYEENSNLLSKTYFVCLVFCT
jgi:hypothetical protein